MGRSFDIIAKPKKTRVDPPASKAKKNNCLTYIIVLAILAGVIYFASAQFKVDNHKVIPKDMPKEADKSTSNYTPSPTASVSAEETENKENESENNKIINGDIDKAQISIKILNATGKSNAAKTTQEELEKIGFKIAEVGTAKNIYANSIIYYNTSKESQANFLSENLTSRPKIQEDNNITNNFDLVYVIGKN